MIKFIIIYVFTGCMFGLLIDLNFRLTQSVEDLKDCYALTNPFIRYIIIFIMSVLWIIFLPIMIYKNFITRKVE